jgi:hypothetical protein
MLTSTFSFTSNIETLDSVIWGTNKLACNDDRRTLEPLSNAVASALLIGKNEEWKVTRISPSTQYSIGILVWINCLWTEVPSYNFVSVAYLVRRH